MSIIFFLIILSILVFVHELGHFLIAKKNGIRVDEFAVGFPPRIFSFKKGGTVYALNIIPFGGYVKIFGENPDNESLDPEAQDSFVNKSKLVQAFVLVGGVLFNILFAWLLFSISFMTGAPAAVTEDNRANIEGEAVVVTSILPDSPAFNSDLQAGDKILMLSTVDSVLEGDFSIEELQAYISSKGDQEMQVTVNRAEDIRTLSVTPEEGIVEGKAAVGISMDLIGTLKLPIHKAVIEGFVTTYNMLIAITVGLFTLISNAILGQADLGQVAGPVGIVSLVGDAAEFGFVYLLTFTAFISLNLAVLNLIPFPALDGGRLLFVAVEAITRKPIKTSVANAANAIGFAILILLMIVITVNDVIKLF